MIISMLTIIQTDLLRKEVDKVQMSQYVGIECDSDEDVEDDASDVDYVSDDDSTRKVVDYDLDKMFEIIKKRDFNKWSLPHIHNQYTKIPLGDSGRKQLSR